MTEAPKKIWYSFEYEKRIIAGANEEDTPYIRADLVDGLVEALEEFVPPTQAVDAPCHFGIVPQSDCAYCNRIKKAKAALKALEEEWTTKNC